MEYQNANTHYEGMWQQCLVQIRKSLSEDDFVRWFKHIEAVAFDGAVLKLQVPNQEHYKYIEQNFIPILRPIVRNVFGVKARVTYSIPKPSAEQQARGYATEPDRQIIKNPFVIPGIKKVQFDSQLQPELTFRNHIEGDCNRLARSAGISISINPGTTSFNPLFIYGNSGLGKTHIAQAVGNATKERHPDSKVLYVSANHFQSQFQTAAWRGELNDFIHFYQMIDVLIIDDIQEFAGKPGTQNIFFNIFNHLRLLGKQIILTSDRPPVELKDIEDRLITRFKWGLSAGLTPPDHQTKVSILQAKCSRMGLILGADIIDFLAENIKANIRELEGALTSLEAHSSLLGKEISFELAHRIMQDIVKISSKEVNIDLIMDLVSEQMKISRTQLLSKERTREVATARQVVMYLCKQHTKTPLTVIGAAIGGRNHATVLHAHKNIINMIDTDRSLRKHIEEMERKLL